MLNVMYQDKIGETTIKTRLEQQTDNLDVTDTHYDKKYQIYRDDGMLYMIE